ncbi:hypothetical protein DWY45_13110 [Phocaeicola plebeius]|uniref:Uncharacterized protein n=1 Tax=Phocaeicola plebeius TaxID=310297 RepID=A0A414R928_9BACT|nr:hypothetical protein DWY45_13110 [Phocaeicola plebeius]RHF89513.1 hypothetical protein DW653_10475 [Phocaeicola plebeius]
MNPIKLSNYKQALILAFVVSVYKNQPKQNKPTEAKRTSKTAMLSDKQPSPNKRKGFERNPKA